MSELLLELFSEEIPARLQATAEKDLKRLFLDFCKNASIGCDGIETFSTPRRIGFVAKGLPHTLPASSSLTKGPRIGAPEAALEGFCRKLAIDYKQLIQNEGFYWAQISLSEQSTLPLIQNGIVDLIKSFPWAKTMRSANSDFRWIRPLRSIVLLFDEKIVPIEINGLISSNTTYGHRFLSANNPIIVKSYSDFKAKLKKSCVIINRSDRKEEIIEKSKLLCSKNDLLLIDDDELLEEVVGLVEWPSPLIGPMNPQFLTLPAEVIRTSMRTHQKYFALKDQHTGKLSPYFLLVSNISTKDEGAEIIRGNAKVLSARLSDAQFFYNEDQKQGNFDRWRDKLKGVTHHAKLGDLWIRSLRIENLAKGLADSFAIDVDQSKTAALLLKSDLASSMVGEFPELQGLMGGDYAIKSGFSDEIGAAIAEHYKPQGPNDTLPQTRLGALMALSDKLDILFAFFAIDEKPTGSKDPFALRRSALGVLRILNNFGIDIDLKSMLTIWYRGLIHYAGPGQCVFIDTKKFNGKAGPRWNHGGNEAYQNYLRDFYQGLEESAVKVLATDREFDLEIKFEIVERPGKPEPSLYEFRSMPEVLSEFEEFLNTRLKVMIKDYGIRWEQGSSSIIHTVPDNLVDAVIFDNQLSVRQKINRIDQLHDIMNDVEGDNILSGFKRAHNILGSANYAKPSIKPRIEDFSEMSFETVEESDFFQNLLALITQWKDDESVGCWRQNLKGYSDLKSHLDGFLDSVLVMHEDLDIRSRRLGILAIYRDLGLKLYDWTKLLA